MRAGSGRGSTVRVMVMALSLAFPAVSVPSEFRQFTMVFNAADKTGQR
jgi:hypothetical protein